MGLAGLLAPQPSVAAQTFEGTITMRLVAPGREGPRTQEVQYQARGGKVRLTVASPMGEMAMIASPAEQKAYLLLDAQRMYLELPLPSPKSAATEPPPAAGRGRPGGAIDTVAGYPCTHRRLTLPDGRGGSQRLDACMSTALGPYLNPLTAMRGAMGGMMGGRSAGWQEALAAEEGFPLKVTLADGTVAMEVTAVEKRRVSAALFAVPADYVLQPLPKRPPG